MNVADLTKAMFAAKADIDAAFEEVALAIHADAEADKQARLAWATAYLSAVGPVKEREAVADKGTVNERYAAKMAEGARRAAFSAMESRRQWLSALQSLASLSKAEAQISAWEPREVQSA